MMNHNKFHYKKVVVEEEHTTWFAWYLINKETREGVHFHGIQYKNTYPLSEYKPWDNNQHNFSARGVERHSKTPIYDGQSHIKDCEVTGGDCFCDGTSIGAIESLGFINPKLEGHEEHIWGTLHMFYKDWFEGDEN